MFSSLLLVWSGRFTCLKNKNSHRFFSSIILLFFQRVSIFDSISITEKSQANVFGDNRTKKQRNSEEVVDMRVFCVEMYFIFLITLRRLQEARKQIGLHSGMPVSYLMDITQDKYRRCDFPKELISNVLDACMQERVDVMLDVSICWMNFYFSILYTFLSGKCI